MQVFIKLNLVIAEGCCFIPLLHFIFKTIYISEGSLYMKIKTIGLPYCDALSPTLESTALKIAEECGELCRAIGKFRGLSGEKAQKLEEKEALKEVLKELLDVAQSSMTMAFLLEEEHGLDLNDLVDEHIQKLIKKGYINP